MFPAHWLQPWQRLDTLATLYGDEIVLTTLSPAIFLRFLGGTGPSPSYPLLTVPNSLPRSQPSLVLLSMQDKTAEFFLQRRRTSSAGSDSPPPELSCIWASSARHLWHYFFHFWSLDQTFGLGPTVGSPCSSSTPPIPQKGSGSTITRIGCWASVEFLYAPILWKRSDLMLG